MPSKIAILLVLVLSCACRAFGQEDSRQLGLGDPVTIPLWLAVTLVALIVLVIVGLIVWFLFQRRWIRVRGIVLLTAGFFSVPAITVVAKAYGIEVSIGEVSWPAAAVAGLGIFCLYRIEMVVQRGEVSDRLLYEFQMVLKRQMTEGISVEGVARELEVPKSRVIAIHRCISEVTQLLSGKQGIM
jgi:hypothetical protein